MKSPVHCRLLILGSGEAAWTAAIYAARANLSPLVITADKPEPDITPASESECWPGIQKGMTQKKLISDMKTQALNVGARVSEDVIIKAALSEHPFRLIARNSTYSCDALIIAKDSLPDFSGISGVENFVGKGVSTNVVYDGYLFKGQDVVVAGKGEDAIEDTRWLSNIARKVYLVTSADTAQAADVLMEKVRSGKVVIFEGHSVSGFSGNDTGLASVKIRSERDNNELDIHATGCFISGGYIPDTALFSGEVEMKDGFIRVKGEDETGSTATSVAGVFAAGSITEYGRPLAVISARSGCMAALDAERFLSRKNSQEK